MNGFDQQDLFQKLKRSLHLGSVHIFYEGHHLAKFLNYYPIKAWQMKPRHTITLYSFPDHLSRAHLQKVESSSEYLQR